MKYPPANISKWSWPKSQTLILPSRPGLVLPLPETYSVETLQQRPVSFSRQRKQSRSRGDLSGKANPTGPYATVVPEIDPLWYQKLLRRLIPKTFSKTCPVADSACVLLGKDRHSLCNQESFSTVQHPDGPQVSRRQQESQRSGQVTDRFFWQV